MGNGDIPVNGTDEPDHQGLERTGRWETHAKHILILNFEILFKKFLNFKTHNFNGMKPYDSLQATSVCTG